MKSYLLFIIHNFILLNIKAVSAQLSVLESQPRVESLASSSWFSLLVLGILIALALSLSTHRKQYTLYVRNFLNKQGRVMNYDTESTSVVANVFLWLVVAAGFVLMILSYSQTVHFLILFAIVLGFFALKWLLIRFIGYVFGAIDLARAFSTDYFVLIAVLGLLLLPFDLAVIYLPQVSDTVWLIFLSIIAFLALITLFIKLLQIFYSGFSSLFYIFLYLCTSEILPLFVVVKMASIVVINV